MHPKSRNQYISIFYIIVRGQTIMILSEKVYISVSRKKVIRTPILIGGFPLSLR